MTPTPTDPAEIDLEEIAHRYLNASTAGQAGMVNHLIAAVEALRDEVGGLNIDLVNAGNDNEELRERVAELNTSFDLSWDADMRAIKVWQEETGKSLNMRAIKVWQEETGKSLTWPDQCRLVVWLLKRLDAAEAEAAEAQSAALSAAPAEALERARTVEEIVTAAGDLMHRFNDTRAVAFGIAYSEDANIFAEWDTLEIALARLDLSTEAPADAE